ncbi:MAG: nitroreductase family deazaflavin-dependent oxidoreductase [Chloroflexi bacterium]|nr:MAG: nitroreductase family deazaflavin-dependent oxidoreductase [Chloroflexota bacterium]
MVATARAATPVRATRSARPDLASEFFRTLNSVVEPLVRAGCFSPNLFAPTGLIVLETTGRRSGKPHHTPVLAMLMDSHLIVRTFRGERSEWFKNLRKNPDVAYWTRGEKKAARAVIHAPGEECQIEGLPAAAALGITAAATAVRMLGWRFAVLAPQN